MRIYRRKDFIALPAGTLFCKGKPWYFENLQVKGDTWRFSGGGTEFGNRQLQWIAAHDSGDAGDRLDAMLETGASFPLEDAYGRDGCFDEDDLFLVYEKADLEEMAAVIRQAIAVGVQ